VAIWTYPLRISVVSMVMLGLELIPRPSGIICIELFPMETGHQDRDVTPVLRHGIWHVRIHSGSHIALVILYMHSSTAMILAKVHQLTE